MTDKTKTLIDIWMSYKYWTSCCEDEAIDWCNHQGDYKLTPDEMEEFIAWRDAMKSIEKDISKHLNPSLYPRLSELLFAL